MELFRLGENGGFRCALLEWEAMVYDGIVCIRSGCNMKVGGKGWSKRKWHGNGIRWDVIKWDGVEYNRKLELEGWNRIGCIQ